MSDRVTTMHQSPHVLDDAALLDLYCRTRSTEAFTSIVERHSGWVNALARRKVKDRHLAEDVTQAVFIVLARKANSIRRDTPLSAWLFRVARFAANDAVKQESRRRVRLNRVAEARAAGQSGRLSQELDLDEAIACLSDSDRQTILLRFYEEKSMAEIGQTLGINEVAAKKRVSRALRRLRELMARRGIPAMSIAMLAMLLLRETRAAPAASARFVQTVARGAAGLTEPSGASARLADAAAKRLAGAQSRLLAALAGASLLLALAVSSISPVMGQIVAPFVEMVQSIIAPTVVSSDTPKAPAPSSVAQEDPPPITRAWAGRGGDLGWPIYPSGGTDWPIRIDAPSGINPPVVIVQDSRGHVWYRPIDADQLPSPAAARADYEELTPYSASRAIEEMIARDSIYFRDAAGGAAQGPWRRIDHVGDDGSIVLPEFELEYFEFFVDGLPLADPALIEQFVPEPTGLLAVAACGGILLLRRRQRSANLRLMS